MGWNAAPMWSALRVTIFYAAFGLAWIWGSDTVANWIAGDSLELQRYIQNGKGTFYIFLTSLLLYLLVRYETSRYISKENDFQKLFLNNPQPMWIYDLETLAFLDVNPSAINKYGYSREEFLSKTIKDIRPREDIPSLMASVNNGRLPFQDSGDWRHLSKSGQIFIVKILSHTIEYKGRNAALVMAYDITESRRLEKHRLENETLRIALEKEKESQKRRDRFVSMISHEFRNPLAAIKASVGIMQKFGEKLDESRRSKHLKSIDNQSQSLLELLDEMLAILRMEAAKGDFKPELLNLNALCEQTIENIKNTYTNAPKIEFICEADAIEAEADLRLLRRILENLLTNAVKYSPNGGTILIELSRLSHIFIVRVRDEGIGIPKESLPTLFEPFFRASNTGAIQGTGLGLAIVKQAVEMHSGMIEVDSVEGMGTSFEIRMPLRQNQSEEFEQVLIGSSA